MKDLIEALQIMLKNGDVSHPTHCYHDELHVFPNSMTFTETDIKRLDELGFYINEEGDGFFSFRFGSC